MKKRFTIVVTAAFCLALLATAVGCSSDSSDETSDGVDYTGTWVFSSMDDGSGEVTTADDLGLSTLDMEPADIAYITFGSDGSVEFVVVGSDMLDGTDATWEATSTGLNITDSSGSNAFPVVYSAEDDTIELTVEDSGQTIWFVRDTADTATDTDSDDATDDSSSDDDSASTDESSE